MAVGVADIVESTRAIANQRYKAVNMAGAAVIAAVTNALDGREFPFVFGGDGGRPGRRDGPVGRRELPVQACNHHHHVHRTEFGQRLLLAAFRSDRFQ